MLVHNFWNSYGEIAKMKEGCQTGQIPVSGSYCYLAYDWTVLDIWKGKEIQKILGIQKRPKMRIPGSCDVTKEFLGD